MNVLVTGGGTIAPIDDVRFIANASTGRFSAEIAEACLDRGATVWHLHAPTAQLPSARGRLHLIPLTVGTVADYSAALRSALRDHPVDVVFLAMAVSDFEPEPVSGKIDSRGGELLIRCRPTPKVIASVRDWAPDAYLVGFKLLSGSSDDELIRAAEEVCRANRVDLTVANDLSRYDRANRLHTIHLVRPGHAVETFGPEGPVAEALVERVFDWAKDKAGTEQPISR